jgi:hypothetical protein
VSPNPPPPGSRPRRVPHPRRAPPGRRRPVSFGRVCHQTLPRRGHAPGGSPTRDAPLRGAGAPCLLGGFVTKPSPAGVTPPAGPPPETRPSGAPGGAAQVGGDHARASRAGFSINASQRPFARHLRNRWFTHGLPDTRPVGTTNPARYAPGSGIKMHTRPVETTAPARYAAGPRINATHRNDRSPPPLKPLVHVGGSGYPPGRNHRARALRTGFWDQHARGSGYPPGRNHGARALRTGFTDQHVQGSTRYVKRSS